MISSILGNKAIKNQTYLIEPDFNKYANNIALSIKENNVWKELNYKQLNKFINNFANKLFINGFKTNERLAILSESKPEWAITFFGALRAGAIIIPLDVKLTLNELNIILNDCKPTVLCISKKFLDTANDIKTLVPSITQIYIIEENINETKIDENNKNITEIIPIKKINDVALIIYTSGTTDQPKGVMITFNNLITQINDLKQLYNINQEEVFLSLLPLNHLLELTCGFLYTLYAGANIVYTEKLNSKSILTAMKEKKVTFLICVPLILRMFKRNIEKEINNQGYFKKLLFKTMLFLAGKFTNTPFKRHIFKEIHNQFGGKLKCFISGGAPLDEDLIEFFDHIAIPIYQGYGLTETSPILAVNTPDNNKYKSVGKAMPSVTIRLSEQNEILAQGPNIMKGYYNQKKLTEEVIDNNGWLHTGDIGAIDKDGYVYIKGRIKNLIVLNGGKKVFPEEIESILSTSPYFKEFCIVGINKKDNNNNISDYICALIVPTDDIANQYDSNKPELEKFITNEVHKLSHNIAKFKRPTRIITLDKELPKTTTCKIKRNKLLEIIDL